METVRGAEGGWGLWSSRPLLGNWAVWAGAGAGAQQTKSQVPVLFVTLLLWAILLGLGRAVPAFRPPVLSPYRQVTPSSLLKSRAHPGDLRTRLSASGPSEVVIRLS